MKTTMLMIGLAALTMTSTVARADQSKKEKKFCDAIAKFHSDLRTLDNIGPSSTLEELRTAVSRVDDDTYAVQKTAGRIKTETAKEFSSAAKQLRSETNRLRKDMTIEEARSKLDDDITRLKKSETKLVAESGCPENAPSMKEDTE